MRVAFLGLGNMGRGMVRNLLKAGNEVVVYNRTRAKADELAKEGAMVAEHPAAIKADVAFTMVADDAALEQIVFGPQGLISGLPKGAASFRGIQPPLTIETLLGCPTLGLRVDLVPSHGLILLVATTRSDS